MAQLWLWSGSGSYDLCASFVLVYSDRSGMLQAQWHGSGLALDHMISVPHSYSVNALSRAGPSGVIGYVWVEIMVL